MRPMLLRLDTGTTIIKAGAFNLAGQPPLSAEKSNHVSPREGALVAQVMEITRREALWVLGDPDARLGHPRAEGIVLIGQGDGLWLIDANGDPVLPELIWLDGRARDLATELPEALDAVKAITCSRLTAASQSLRLLWLWHHDPARRSLIRHALHLNERLFFALTDKVRAAPSAALPARGRWQTGEPCPDVDRALGLSNRVALLPELCPMDDAPVSLARTGLVGLAALGARFLQGLPSERIERDWNQPADDVIAPETGAVAAYAARKYACFVSLVETLAPHWPKLDGLRPLSEEITP